MVLNVDVATQKPVLSAADVPTMPFSVAFVEVIGLAATVVVLVGSACAVVENVPIERPKAPRTRAKRAKIAVDFLTNCDIFFIFLIFLLVFN